MAKAKRKVTHGYTVGIRMTTRALVYVEAASVEEAEAMVKAGRWEEPDNGELLDWEVVGSAELDE